MCTLLIQTFCLVCDMQALALNNNQIGDTGMIKFSEALATGAMEQLQVSWLPTAMLPCLETWHTRSSGLTVSFGVLYVPYAEALPPIKLYRRCGCNGSGPGVRRWRNGPVAGELAPHCHDPMP